MTTGLRISLTPIALLFVLGLTTAGCDSALQPAENTVESAETQGHLAFAAKAGRLALQAYDNHHNFTAPVFDIDATPDGSILVAESATIKEIRRGDVGEVTEIPTVPGSAINGLETIGRRVFFATSAGLDRAEGAGVWHVSQGRVRLVGDIETFETANDPDAFEGPQWKNPVCEEPEFTAGPQSNPYHLTRLTGSTVLVADAAGNTLLSTKKDGSVDWVAVFTPPVDENGDFRILKTADGNPEIDCFVQPVPTSVDIGPDGAYYVGELTGLTAGELAGGLAPAWSRVWRIEPGAHNVVCPSNDCQEVISGLTSVIDIEFGPDGNLIVVEFDTNGWFAAAVLGNTAGGTVKKCDVDAGTCNIVEDGLALPSAITFEKLNNLWVVENNFATGVATVHPIDLP